MRPPLQGHGTGTAPRHPRLDDDMGAPHRRQPLLSVSPARGPACPLASPGPRPLARSAQGVARPAVTSLATFRYPAHMPLPEEVHELTALMRSGIPLILVETHEEPRIVRMLEQACNAVNQPLYTWSIANGIARHAHTERIAQTYELLDALKHIDKTPQNGVYALCDAHPGFKDAVCLRLMREIALEQHKTTRTLVFVSPRLEGLPGELLRLAAHFRPCLPDRQQIRKILADEVALHESVAGTKAKGDKAVVDRLILHLAGMEKEDVRRFARQALRGDGVINEADLQRVVRTKYEALGSAGALELQESPVKFDDLGGLSRLKEWAALRQRPFVDGAADEIDRPKGILLFGVQGGGKSLAARAVAGEWGVPLMRLDIGTLYNKFHGETERNLRSALAGAESMTPCVLWIDELDKALSTDGSQGDDGVSRRVLGTLLTWMAERTKPVFLVATANDLSRLPPELIRKGRFDEIFFVDLPDQTARRNIAAIHLRKRRLDPGQFDLDTLATRSEGFSGAELEQAIVAARFRAQARGAVPATHDVLEELASTRPLSVLMAEKLSALRHWASQRAVFADGSAVAPSTHETELTATH